MVGVSSQHFEPDVLKVLRKDLNVEPAQTPGTGRAPERAELFTVPGQADDGSRLGG